MLRVLRQVIPSSLRKKIGRWRRLRSRGTDLRWGADFITEVHSRTSIHARVIFDVGANIGLTALDFADNFPDATVHAFEPGSNNMSRLESNLVGRPDIRRHKLAFGERPGLAELLIEPDHPTMARIAVGKGPVESVQVLTIDDFCDREAIDHIDILKIDTEGFEIPVLRGALQMLSQGRISIVKAECAIDPDHSYHTSLFSLCELLHPAGYRLFGFYEQFEDPFVPTARIRRFDAAFIAAELYGGKTHAAP